MKVTELIFANFWTWLGALILLATLLSGLAEVIKALRKPEYRPPERSVRVTTYEDETTIVQIENATAEDVERAVLTFCMPGKKAEDLVQESEGGK